MNLSCLPSFRDGTKIVAYFFHVHAEQYIECPFPLPKAPPIDYRTSMQVVESTGNHSESSGLDLEHLAREVTRRGFGVPAIFVLEMYKPLMSLAHAGVAVGAPLLLPIFGSTMYRSALQLLESPEQIEDLIRRIEVLSKNNRKGK